MKNGPLSSQLRLGWLTLVLISVGQAPVLYGEGDPSCPNCQAGRQGYAPLAIPPAPPADTAAPQSPSAGWSLLTGTPPALGLYAMVPQAAHASALASSAASSLVATPPPYPVMPPTTGAPHGMMQHGMLAQIAPGGAVGEASLEAEPSVPIVKLRVKAPACGVVGKEMEYRIKVENCSPADAHHVVVRTSLPASVRVLRTSPHAHVTTPELQWNLGTLPGFGCHDLIIVATPIGLADIRSCTRVQFEHGQCVTTKVAALAPEGSADGTGRFPGVGPGAGPGVGPGVGPGHGPEPGVGFGQGGTRGDLEVLVDGPKEATPGQPVDYKITVFNKSDRPLYKVGVLLEWNKDFFLRNSSEKITGPPGLMAWPDGLIEQLAPATSRSLILTLETRAEGVLCIKASASGNVSNNPADRTLNAKHEFCTLFRRGIPGMTMEMFDREDPILRFGQTSYPIVVRNQGQDPITNLRIRARVPDQLEVDQVRGPVQYRSGFNPRKEFWVEFDPLPRLGAGETQNFEISVKARGQEGDARLQMEMTADQLDRAADGSIRWLREEESTTVVPDEESRVRIREISRQKHIKLSIAMP